jgi:hypothetical protein
MCRETSDRQRRGRVTADSDPNSIPENPTPAATSIASSASLSGSGACRDSYLKGPSVIPKPIQTAAIFGQTAHQRAEFPHVVESADRKNAMTGTILELCMHEAIGESVYHFHAARVLPLSTGSPSACTILPLAHRVDIEMSAFAPLFGAKRAVIIE